MKWRDLFQVHKALPPRARALFGWFSFVLPILVWSIVSYVPSVWHPLVLITSAGSVDYLTPGMRMDRRAFDNEVADASKENKSPPRGVPANPIYLPAPHEVAAAF